MFVEAEDESIALALRHSDFTDALNRETLKVTGLSAGRYRLQIDDEAVGAFDASQLAKGVNLAILKTPMSRQAQTVLDLTMMMVENALKEYHPVMLKGATDAMDSLHEEILSMQRAAAIPKPHRYRVTAVE